MTGTSFISESVRHAVELAGCAPSIHNSQPWAFVVSEERIDLYADHRRWLPATDADQRDLMLSCGAALHHLRIGLAAAGVAASVYRMPNAAKSDLVASIVLGEDGTDRVDATLSDRIPLRRSDRRPFRSWPMPEAFQRQLTERAAEQGALLRMITDPDARAVLVTAFAAAAAAQSGAPGYAQELQDWTDRPGAEGIPASNLARPVSPTVEAARDFGGQRVLSYNVEPEEATLLVIGTSSDDQLSQLRAGEAIALSCWRQPGRDWGTVRSVSRWRSGPLARRCRTTFSAAPSRRKSCSASAGRKRTRSRQPPGGRSRRSLGSHQPGSEVAPSAPPATGRAGFRRCPPPGNLTCSTSGCVGTEKVSG